MIFSLYAQSNLASPIKSDCTNNASQGPETDLEQRSNVHVEAQVSETGGDDLGASVVTILSHLGHQQSWVPALVPLEIRNSVIQERQRNSLE